MNEKIHENLEAARKACQEYVHAISELSERLGIVEECDDSCCEIHISAKYKSDDGTILTYYH
jgi:hypothetical protein